MPEQINVFIIYAREDREVKQGLLRHLSPLRDAYNLNIWHDDHIEPGQEWKPSIESRLEKTDLFLLLVSADFMNSEFIHQVEFKFAIDRHKQNKSIVIPVIIDYCLWDIDIRFKDYNFNLRDLQVLPDEGKPVGEWKSKEQAYNNIAGGIRKVLTAISERHDPSVNAEAGKIEAKKTRDEEIRQKKLKKDREESLQRQIAAQQEKEKEDNAPAVTGQETTANKGAGKKILYGVIAIAALAILSYFIFRKPDKTISKEDGESTITAMDTASSHTTQAPVSTGEDKSEPKRKGDTIVRDHRTPTIDVPVNSFNTFPNALAAVFRDAPNNFASLKGEFNGTKEGMRKYKTTLTLRDKNFLPLYLLENGKDWTFVFINKNNSNYKSMQLSIVYLLEGKNIKYDYEPSASMASARYTWDNGKFEIYLFIRKYTDNFVEIDFYHRD